MPRDESKRSIQTRSLKVAQLFCMETCVQQSDGFLHNTSDETAPSPTPLGSATFSDTVQLQTDTRIKIIQQCIRLLLSKTRETCVNNTMYLLKHLHLYQMILYIEHSL